MAILAFDVETDRLLDSSRTNFGDLRITVAAASEVGRGRAAASSFYADPVGSDEPPLSGLADALEGACTVVAFNGRGFDMRVLRNHFASEAVERWTRKLIDPFEAMREHTGSWVKLDELLEANGLAQKSGDGVSAVEWWAAGERRKVADYCCQDVEGLRRLLELGKIAFPVKRWQDTGEGRKRHQVVTGWAELDWDRHVAQQQGMHPSVHKAYPIPF